RSYKYYTPIGVLLLKAISLSYLPIYRFVVLQKLSAPMFSGKDAIEEGVTDPCSAIYNIERRLKVMYLFLKSGQVCRIFVGNPARINGIHVYAIFGKITCRSMRHHI